MEYAILGNSGIRVSKLCFGTLTMSPLQANLPLEEGADLIKYGFSKGINFFDTAEIYNNYDYLRKALKGIDRDQIVIATKSYSYSKETAKKSLEMALKEIGTDYIDVFLLHEQESEYTIKGHYEAIEFFLKAKKMGKIRAFGISTHFVNGVLAANKYEEIEILHPILNMIGLGIQDGNINDMLKAIEVAHNKKKGIYGMKPLGGGHLIGKVEEAFEYVKKIKFIDSIAIGMQSKKEIDANVLLLEKGYIPEELKKSIDKSPRKLHIADWCIGCGKCVETCQHEGIIIVDNKAKPIQEKCVFCGYCASGCPEFCIKVI